MIDPKQNQPEEDEHTAEREPELESETLKDLTAPEDQAEEVKGGAAMPYKGCGWGTW